MPCRAFLLPGPFEERGARKCSGRLRPVRRILAVVAISLSCLAACGSDPLDSCFRETAGNLNCSSVNLSEMNLSGMNLSGANLTSVNFHRANLEGANLEGASADVWTVWPEGFDPEAGGVFFP